MAKKCDEEMSETIKVLYDDGGFALPYGWWRPIREVKCAGQRLGVAK